MRVERILNDEATLLIVQGVVPVGIIDLLEGLFEFPEFDDFIFDPCRLTEFLVTAEKTIGVELAETLNKWPWSY